MEQAFRITGDFFNEKDVSMTAYRDLASRLGLNERFVLRWPSISRPTSNPQRRTAHFLAEALTSPEGWEREFGVLAVRELPAALLKAYERNLTGDLS